MGQNLETDRAHVLDMERAMARVVIGQRRPIRMAIIALLSGGHVLFEGVPGVAKTLLLRCLARMVSGGFERVQGSPDLMPSDLIGRTKPRFQGDDLWIPGPLLADNLIILLLDEINRTPTKTQSALLEAMQERQVTVDRKTLRLHQAFFVVATRNPLERGETFELPEAQRDRFMFETEMHYPSIEDEIRISIDPRYRNMSALVESLPVLISPDEILEIRGRVERGVQIREDLMQYIAHIVDATRNPAVYGVKEIVMRRGKSEEKRPIEEVISAGASPRATQDLAYASRFVAWLAGRTYVSAQDVQEIAPDVLLHRIFFAPGLFRRSSVAKSFLAAILQHVRF